MAETLNYTALDFNTIKQELIRKLSQENNFKDFNFTGSNINTILELFSSVGDIFNFYINMLADESFLLTADMYENMNKLVELVGYNPGGYKSSNTTLIFTSTPLNLSGADNYKIEIPRFSKFKSSQQTADGDDIYFFNADTIIHVIDTNSLLAPLSATTFNFEIPVVQGISTLSGSELNFTGDGTIYQKYVLAPEKATEENLKVTVNDGFGDVEWIKVDNLFNTTNTSTQIYTTRYNKDQRVEIKFGDGTFGDVPALGSTIKVSYITSLGSQGNINSSLIEPKIEGDIYLYDTLGFPVNGPFTTYALTQSNSAIGGSDPETVEQLRNRAPALVRTQNRAVTKQDYGDLISSKFGRFVYKIKALNFNETYPGAPEILQSTYYNTIFLLVVPVFGDIITRDLRDEIDRFLEDYKMATIEHSYLDTSYVKINFKVNYVKKATSQRTIGEIEGRVRNVLTSYFSKFNRDLGELINHSTIVNKILEIDDLDSVILKMWRDDTAFSESTSNINIQLSNVEFPKFGSLNFEA